MVLNLGQAQENYKEFFGEIIEQMPKLIAEGRVPMNVNQLMQRRLDVRNASQDLKSFWMDNCFDTGDAVVYHPKGGLKIVLDSQYLRQITPESEINNGALVLTEDDYRSMEGEEFKKGKPGQVNEWLSKQDVKSHPVWKVLARDQNLLNDYANYIFAEGKQKFGYESTMGVFIDSEEYEFVLLQHYNSELRMWYVNGLEDGSDAVGSDNLDDDDGYLVGIAPEAQSTLGKSVPKISTYTVTDLEAFDNVIKGLEGILNPDVLKPFVQLREKL